MKILETPEDMNWLAEVHHPLAKHARLAILQGNEDAPIRVYLYIENNLHTLPAILEPDRHGKLVVIRQGDMPIPPPTPRLSYWLRPECGREDRMGPDVGPFPDYVQLTYDLITTGPDGEIIGNQDGSDWRFVPSRNESGPRQGEPLPTRRGRMHNCTLDNWHTMPWSDVVIWAEASGE
jgi:hypothetical protein